MMLALLIWSTVQSWLMQLNNDRKSKLEGSDTDRDQTGMTALYIILYMYQKPDCNSVISYGIYIPASIKNFYHMLHTGEGAMDCTCS